MGFLEEMWLDVTYSQLVLVRQNWALGSGASGTVASWWEDLALPCYSCLRSSWAILLRLPNSASLGVSSLLYLLQVSRALHTIGIILYWLRNQY